MLRVEKQVTVLNKKGLGTRAAMAFVDTVKNFKSSVTVVKGKEQVNGRSGMGLLVLGATYQTSLRIIVEGDDAEEAMQGIEDFFAKEAAKSYPDSHFVKYLLFICLGIFLLLIIALILR